MDVEVIKYYDKEGKDYYKDIYHEGIWVGMAIVKFMTKEEAYKLGYRDTLFKEV